MKGLNSNFPCQIIFYRLKFQISNSRRFLSNIKRSPLTADSRLLSIWSYFKIGYLDRCHQDYIKPLQAENQRLDSFWRDNYKIWKNIWLSPLWTSNNVTWVQQLGIKLTKYFTTWWSWEIYISKNIFESQKIMVFLTERTSQYRRCTVDKHATAKDCHRKQV